MRHEYAAAVHDALRMMGGNTAHIAAVQDGLDRERAHPKVATETHNLVQSALHELVPHMTTAHVGALKAKGHGVALDEAIRDMSFAQLKRAHKAHLGPVPRGAVRRDLEVGLRQHVRAIPEAPTRRHRPESFGATAEAKTQAHLTMAVERRERNLAKRQPPAVAPAPSGPASTPSAGHQWEPVLGKPGRRKRRLPSGRYHYEDEPLQKADEARSDYLRRLISWHLGEIEALHKGLLGFGPSHERVAGNLVKLGAEVKRLAGQVRLPKMARPKKPRGMKGPRQPKLPAAPKAPRLPKATGFGTSSVSAEEDQA